MKLTHKFSDFAFIREAECIGCTKCIEACPVDAILGTSKQMHTVITDECISCKLCVPACPVDCIDMIESVLSRDNHIAITERAKDRIKARKSRLKKMDDETIVFKIDHEIEKRKTYSAGAIERAKIKRMK